uniref:Uncharacterized protein n=1 Tax=Tetranychus urticae TaxID=32264 RepID=T1K4M1_TETUR
MNLGYSLYPKTPILDGKLFSEVKVKNDEFTKCNPNWLRMERLTHHEEKKQKVH